MDWANLLFSFTGRIARAKFWLGILIVALANIANVVISLEVLEYPDAVLLFAIPVWWMLLALCTKRLHDVDTSAWALIGVIVLPFFVLILGSLEGTKGDNRFGATRG